MVDRYGPAIEVDLHRMGLDLVDFFRGRHSWRKLELLLRRMHNTSQFIEALLNDPDVAESIIAEEQARRRAGLPDPVSRPRWSEYTPEASRLDSVVDALNVVASLLAQQISQKPQPPVRPRPRPETEIDRKRARDRQARHDSLVAEVEEAQARRRALAAGT